MPIKLKAGILALALAGPLSACAAEHSPLPYMSGNDNFGEANRQTMAAQIVDPTPAYQTVVPETSAAHAAQAIDRYNTDKVKHPDKGQTASAGGITGGTSGGGGGGSN